MRPLDSRCVGGAAADRALAAGEPVELEELGLLLVPDVLVIEAIANGERVAPTVTLVRDDGRRVFLYRREQEVSP